MALSETPFCEGNTLINRSCVMQIAFCEITSMFILILEHGKADERTLVVVGIDKH